MGEGMVEDAGIAEEECDEEDDDDNVAVELGLDSAEVDDEEGESVVSSSSFKMILNTGLRFGSFRASSSSFPL